MIYYEILEKTKFSSWIIVFLLDLKILLEFKFLSFHPLNYMNLIQYSFDITEILMFDIIMLFNMPR